MPRPVARGQRYMPGLDGLRAIAVAAVIAYHLGLSWAPGGLLGVGVFFTLSGYLITDLLLASWKATGGLQLRTFWLRRARRLLPALFVMLAGVSVWVAVADPSQLGALHGDVLAAALYVSNWWLIFQHVSYFARFGPPAPLGHLWSLAVEEQFYLVWPWLLGLGLLWTAKRRKRRRLLEEAQAEQEAGEDPFPENQEEEPKQLVGSLVGSVARTGGSLAEARRPSAGSLPGADLRALANLMNGAALRAPLAGDRDSDEPGLARRLVAVGGRLPIGPLAWMTLGLAAASALEMAFLYHPSFDPSRIYDGTDTRAFALLIGAALAMVWPSARLTAAVARRSRTVIDTLGVVGLVAIVLLVWRTDQYSPFLYRGGMVILSVATAAVVASAAHPGSRFGRWLGWGPLRWLGVRSYAIYLWHYPVIVLTTPSQTSGPGPLRALGQVAATVVLAELSWRFVETPVRSGALGRAWTRLRSDPRSLLESSSRSRVTCLAASCLLVVACVGLGGALPSTSSHVLHTAAPAGTSQAPVTPVVAPSLPAAVGPTSTSAPSVTAPAVTATSGPPVPSAPLFTSCKQVVDIGDSTSVSLMSSNYLPDPAQRLDAQYARVGVTKSIMEIQGGTSIVEALPGQQDAYQVATQLAHQGFKGCWVLALGTNDAADVFVGSNVGMAARIKRMMSVIGNQPVMWVNTTTLRTSGPYANSNAQHWDRALTSACSAYPNMAVFNWAGMAQPGWFIPDGIHYNSPGSAKRAAAIADALATAFPAHGRPASGSSCVVNGSSSWQLPTFQY